MTAYNKLKLNNTFKNYQNTLCNSQKPTFSIPDIDYTTYTSRISDIPDWQSNAKTKIVNNFQKMTDNLNKLNEVNNQLKKQVDIIYDELKIKLLNLEDLIKKYNSKVDSYNAALEKENQEALITGQAARM